MALLGLEPKAVLPLSYSSKTLSKTGVLMPRESESSPPWKKASDELPWPSSPRGRVPGGMKAPERPEDSLGFPLAGQGFQELGPLCRLRQGSVFPERFMMIIKACSYSVLTTFRHFWKRFLHYSLVSSGLVLRGGNKIMHCNDDDDDNTQLPSPSCR